MVKIVARLRKRNTGLVSALQERGYRVHGTAVEPVAVEPVDEELLTYLNGARPTLLVRASEHLEFSRGEPTGYAEVVCGLEGAALVPLAVERYANGVERATALFETQQRVITVGCLRHNNCVVIRYHEMLWNESPVPRLRSNTFWWGPAESLPRDLQHFRNAALAAQARMTCYTECTHVHYANGHEGN